MVLLAARIRSCRVSRQRQLRPSAELQILKVWALAPDTPSVANRQTPTAQLAPLNTFNGYPNVGVWTDGYCCTCSLFVHASLFAGADLCAMDRTTALSGGAAKMLCVQTSRSYGGVLPADIAGASGAAGTTALPAAGTN